MRQKQRFSTSFFYLQICFERPSRKPKDRSSFCYGTTIRFLPVAGTGVWVADVAPSFVCETMGTLTVYPRAFRNLLARGNSEVLIFSYSSYVKSFIASLLVCSKRIRAS